MVYSVLPDSPVIHLLSFLHRENSKIYFQTSFTIRGAALARGGRAEVRHRPGSGDFLGPPHGTEWRQPLLHFSCLTSVNRQSARKARCSGVLTGRSPQAMWGPPREIRSHPPLAKPTCLLHRRRRRRNPLRRALSAAEHAGRQQSLFCKDDVLDLWPKSHLHKFKTFKSFWDLQQHRNWIWKSQKS